MRILMILVAAAVLLAAGCNTVSGVGQDLQWLGQELQEAAE